MIKNEDKVYFSTGGVFTGYNGDIALYAEVSISHDSTSWSLTRTFKPEDLISNSVVFGVWVSTDVNGIPTQILRPFYAHGSEVSNKSNQSLTITPPSNWGTVICKWCKGAGKIQGFSEIYQCTECTDDYIEREAPE